MVRTRIAPSPTGKDVHIGTIATALMNYAYAKKNHGQFVIRIEDTDQTRLIEGGEKQMLRTLASIGLIADESPLVGGPYGPYRQSERLPLYKKFAEQLVNQGAAYYCTCSKEKLDRERQKKQQQKQLYKYDKYCLSRQKEALSEIKAGKPYVIRLNIPKNKTVAIDDLVRGSVKFNTNDLDDQVLLKSDGFPTYHLAVVVDDHLMQISHVIRGEEWLPSAPKHVLLYQAFGWPLPVYAHVPLLRNPDKSKLSKRKNPVWASDYLGEGILPEALLNYLALMGWSHPQEKEIFSLAEYVKVFDLNDIQKSAPIFDPVKLNWLNGQYIMKMNKAQLNAKILDYYKKYQKQNLDKTIVEKTIPLVQTRMKKLADYYPLVRFIFKQPEKIDFPLEALKQVKDVLFKKYSAISWNHLLIYQITEAVAKESNIKPVKLYMDIRYALSNQKVTAPLFEGMEIIGKEKIISRLSSLL